MSVVSLWEVATQRSLNGPIFSLMWLSCDQSLSQYGTHVTLLRR